MEFQIEIVELERGLAHMNVRNPRISSTETLLGGKVKETGLELAEVAD